MVKLYRLLDNGDIKFADIGFKSFTGLYIAQGYLVTPIHVDLLDMWEEE